MRKIVRSALFFALCAIFLAPPALAATSAKEKALGTYGAWKAYSYKEGGQTVCYMVTTKILKSSGPKKRGTPYVMITHRPTEASTDVISYGAGAIMNEKKGVKLSLDKSSFDLFSVRDTAWARDSQTDHKIASLIKKSTIVQAVSYPTKKGAKSISDQFDLTGAPQAYQVIGKACGLLSDEPKKAQPKKKKQAKKTSV